VVSASAQVSIPRFDERLLVGTLAEVIRKWQLLSFDTDGVLIHDGERVEGLRLLEGRHHRKDARYRVVFKPAESKEEPIEPAPIVLTIVDAAPDKLSFTLRLAAVDYGGASFTVENPLRPSKIVGSLDAEIPADTGRLLRGPVSGGAAVDLSSIPSDSPRSAQGVAQVKHRRGRASAEVAIAQPNSREWVLRVTARVRGGGLLRPLVAIAGPFIRGKFGVELQKSMDKLAREDRRAGRRHTHPDRAGRPGARRDDRPSAPGRQLGTAALVTLSSSAANPAGDTIRHISTSDSSCTDADTPNTSRRPQCAATSPPANAPNGVRPHANVR
jgi:hypothetical protein